MRVEVKLKRLQLIDKVLMWAIFPFHLYRKNESSGRSVVFFNRVLTRRYYVSMPKSALWRLARHFVYVASSATSPPLFSSIRSIPCFSDCESDYAQDGLTYFML